MPNGKPGDSPWTDFFKHGSKLFPDDISARLWAIHAVSPELTQPLVADMWHWAHGDQLDEGRRKLDAIIKDNGIPFEG